MIYIPGDFPSLLLLLTGIVGIFGIGAGALAGIIAGGLAAAGTTAYGIKTGIEGNWPWTDPEAWFTGYAKSLVSPVGEIIADAKGEPSISEQLKGVAGEIAREVDRRASCRLRLGACEISFPPKSRWPAASLRLPTPRCRTPNRWVVGTWTVAAALPATTRQTLRSSRLLGAKFSAARGRTSAFKRASRPQHRRFPYVGGAIGSAVSPAVSAAAPAIATVPSAYSAPFRLQPPKSRRRLFRRPYLRSPRRRRRPPRASPRRRSGPCGQIPSFLGDNASGILQQTLKQAALGAGKGATLEPGEWAKTRPRRSLRCRDVVAQVDSPGGVARIRRAAVRTCRRCRRSSRTRSPCPRSAHRTYVGGTAPGAPTLGSFAASQVPKLAGAGASGLVSHLMQPSQPSQPGAPVYSSRPSYYDVYDIGGQNATYPGRRPYWG